MTQCSMTQSEEGKNWPEGTVSAKMTMNPYLLAMIFEEAYRNGMRPWELVNIALWEKLGQPNQEALMDFAANMEIDDHDPKWKKRLKITARFEVEKAAFRKRQEEGAAGSGPAEE